MRLRYVTGPAYAVVRGGAVVMLTEKVSPELVDELWRALDGEPGVVPLLEVLTGSFGASLASLPPFAIAVADDARVHVAVRGGTSVHVGTAGGQRVAVTGETVTTWAERTLDDVAELAVHAGLVGSAGDLVDGGLPLDGGVVLASSVGVVLAERPRAAAVAPAQAAVAQAAVAPARAAVAPAWAEPVAEAPAVEVPLADLPADDRPSDGLPADEPLAVRGDLGSASSADAPAVEGVPASRVGASPGATPGATARAAAVPVASVPLAAGEAPAAPEDGVGTEVSVGPQFESAPVAVPDAASFEAEAFGETSGYGHLWGSTVHRGVEAAAVRPEEEEGEDEASESGDPAPTAERAPDAEPPAEPPAELAAGEVIPLETIAPETIAPETVAPETVAPETVASETVAPGDDDVDGSTVLSSAIADLRAAATPAAGAAGPDAPGPAFAPAPVPGRPMILARTCPGGHPNPPQRDDCAECGQALAGEARQVPRPPLGVMAVSSGPRISLDRPVVVGRRPRSPRSAGDDLPRLVTVPSPEQDISRSHVEVRLEGWHVLVSDMSTTNGTTLLRPGQPPMRLHPGEPVLVVSSDVVDLGDGVTLTFEGIV